MAALGTTFGQLACGAAWFVPGPKSAPGAVDSVLFGRTCLAAHVEALAMAGLVRAAESFDFGGVRNIYR